MARLKKQTIEKLAFALLIIALIILIILKNRDNGEVIPTAPQMGCLNEDGEPVDWWMVIKYPKLSDNEIEFYREGYAYMYLDADDQSFRASPYSIADIGQGAVTLTLQNMYDTLTESPDTTLVFMYNDDPPQTESSSSSRAHAKGLGAAEFVEDKGFYLVHSIPNWPDPPTPGYQYQFPDYEATYGQSLFCFNQHPSVEYNAITDILAIYFSNAYVIDFPDEARALYPGLVEVLEGTHILDPTEDVFALRSLGGLRITNFAKNKKAQVDLYESMVAPHFDTDLVAETWGRSYMDNYCAGINATYTVQNVKYVNATAIDEGIEWKNTKDHSKWVVSTSEDKVVSCVGGINRMTSQRNRPGGTWCVELPEVHQAFSDLVVLDSDCAAG